MSRKSSITPQKISLYDKPIQMLPKISLYGQEKKPTKYVPPIEFWPDEKDVNDGRLPENQ